MFGVPGYQSVTGLLNKGELCAPTSRIQSFIPSSLTMSYWRSWFQFFFHIGEQTEWVEEDDDTYARCSLDDRMAMFMWKDTLHKIAMFKLGVRMT